MLTNLLRPPWRLPYNSPVTAVIDCFLVLQQSPTRPLGIDWAAPFPSPLRGFKNPKSSPLEVKSICSDVGCGRVFFLHSCLFFFFLLLSHYFLYSSTVWFLVHTHTPPTLGLFSLLSIESVSLQKKNEAWEEPAVHQCVRVTRSSAEKRIFSLHLDPLNELTILWEGNNPASGVDSKKWQCQKKQRSFHFHTTVLF